MSSRRYATLALVVSFATAPALAHHVMDGGLPATLGQGLLSGLGHPVIGFDHLAALVAAGALAAVLGLNLATTLGFVAASLAGVGLHMALLDLPLAELLVALSVMALGAALLARSPAGWPLIGLFALGGVVHGYAFGESIVGAEPTPLVAYLAGLAAIQAAIAAAAFAAVRYRPALARPAGVAVTAAGAAALVLAIG